jgi:hypothetical protein
MSIRSPSMKKQAENMTADESAINNTTITMNELNKMKTKDTMLE